MKALQKTSRLAGIKSLHLSEKTKEGKLTFDNGGDSFVLRILNGLTWTFKLIDILPIHPFEGCR